MQVLTVFLISAAGFSAAAPAISGADPQSISKRDEESAMEDRCDNMHNTHDISDDYPYRMVVKWKENANIGGDGNPMIENSGGVFTFNSDCELTDWVDWNGGGGRPGAIKFDDDDGEDLFVDVKLSNPLFINGGLQPPRDWEVKNEDGDVQDSMEADFECGKKYSSCSPGSCDHFRNCWFKVDGIKGDWIQTDNAMFCEGDCPESIAEASEMYEPDD